MKNYGKLEEQIKMMDADNKKLRIREEENIKRMFNRDIAHQKIQDQMYTENQKIHAILDQMTQNQHSQYGPASPPRLHTQLDNEIGEIHITTPPKRGEKRRCDKATPDKAMRDSGSVP